MAQGILAASLGFLPNLVASTATLAVSAANTWFAMSFIGNGKTLSTVDMFVSALTGSLTAAQLTLEIYSDGPTGDPNASVAGPFNAGAGITGSAWNQWPSINFATTDGTRYWVVVKNLHGTPASNFPTFRYGAGSTAPSQGGTSSSLYGWAKNHTTDASTWPNETRATVGILLGYSDSTWEGTPFSNVQASTVGVGIYAARELGSLFTYAGPTINVRHLLFAINANTGTPTNPLRGRVYSGSSSTPTLVATTTGGPVAGAIGAGLFSMPLASPLAMAPGTYRVVLGTTGSDASTNRYNSVAYTIKNDANSKALMPFATAKQTYTTDGTTFAETDTELIPFGLVLDNGNEFTVSGATGGVIVPTGYVGVEGIGAH